jgi:hypothetical protein
MGILSWCRDRWDCVSNHPPHAYRLRALIRHKPVLSFGQHCPRERTGEHRGKRFLKDGTGLEIVEHRVVFLLAGDAQSCTQGSKTEKYKKQKHVLSKADVLRATVAVKTRLVALPTRVAPVVAVMTESVPIQ